MEIPRDEYEGWLSHPTTQKIFQHIKETRREIADLMAVGHYVDRDRVDATALKTSWACGFIEGLSEILKVYEGGME